MRHTRSGTLACAALVLALLTVPAQAQRHPHGRGHVSVISHSPLLRGGGFYSGFYPPYYFGFAQWYPYPYPVFPAGVPTDPAVSLRLQVTPREAAVFVDGYAAGNVDDYDGLFQRLRLIPGPHEIVIYHPGHRTFRQHLYYNPGSTHTIRHILEPLQPGDMAERPPVPRAMPAYPGAPGQPGAPSAVDPNRPPDPARAGAIALRVQPDDATVLVDGEPWRGPQAQGRLVIQLVEGTHRVRIEKAGFQVFVVDVDVRPGETTSFNVSLLAQ